MSKGSLKSNKLKILRRVILAILPGIVVAGFFTFANPTQKTSITAPVQNGLVGYWNMDSNDIYGSTLYDKSGNGNNGTIYGATSTPGKIKQSLSFDGTDDYVEVADSSSLDITSAITLEAWAKDPPSWLSGWAKRVKLTIDQNDIDTALSNFPILVYLSVSSGRNDDDVSFVFDELQSDDNRKKIAVTKADGETQCYVEIEKWDDANEQAWLWVKVPAITSDADTDLYLYYDITHADNTDYVGDPNSTPAETVWNSNFVFVSHMRDDPNTSNIRDSTGNNNDGAKKNSNEPIEALAPISKGQDFDGSDDQITVPDADNLDFGTLTLFTLEAWIKLEASTTQGIIDKIDQASPNNIQGFSYHYNSTISALRFTLYNGTAFLTLDGTTNIANNAWWHTIFVTGARPESTDVSSWKFYLNGVAEGVAGVKNCNANSNITNSLALLLGVRKVGGVLTQYLNGQMDEVRISNVARSVAWIKATYQTGIDDLLDFGSEETSGKTILSKGTDAYALKMSSDGLTLYGYINNNELSTSVSTPTNWHHYALTYDGSNQKLYIDGTQATSTPKADNINTNSTNLKIGEYFAGEIDEAKIYNRALSEGEILQNYNASKRMIIDSSLTDRWKDGLVLLQTFNGQDMDWSSTTAEALDRSGRGNNGDVVGAVSSIGKVGQALSFDGSDDYVEVADSSSLDITSAITLEAWAKDPPSWLSGWAKRVKLTIDQNDIDSDLSNFPILIYLSTSTGRGDDDVSFIFDEVGSNSKRIAVTKSDGTTPLYTEVEKWDSSNEQAWLWTNVSGTDSVSSTTDTDLYLYYDNSHADNVDYVGDPNSTPAENVWDSNFKFVSHMRDDPNTSSIRDSTENDNDGTKTPGSGAPTEIAGKIDKGQDFDPTNNEYISLVENGTLDIISDLTLEAWVHSHGNSDLNKKILAKRNGLNFYFMGITQDKFYGGIGNGTNYVVTDQATAFPTDTFYHAVMVFNDANNQIQLYLNAGTPETKACTYAPVAHDNPLVIGSESGYLTSNDIDAVMDEVRVSNCIRPAAWIKATYQTGIDDLLDFGSEETSGKTILSKGTDAYALKMSSDGLTLYGYINNNELSTSVSTPTNWHHYALTYDGSNQKLYIDGTQATSTPKADNINTNSTNLKIGEYFAGEIDEVRIYNTALSSTTIAEHYQGGIRKTEIQKLPI